MALSFRHAAYAALFLALWAPLAGRADAELLRAFGEVSRELTHGLRAPAPSCSQTPPSKPDCMAMTNDFCSKLHAAGARGNLDLGAAESRYEIRLGARPNGISEALASLSEAKIAAKGRLPKDFAAALGDGYFEELRAYLGAKGRDGTLEDRDRFQALGGQLSQRWDSALQSATLKRVAAEIPDFYKPGTDPDDQSPQNQLKASEIRKRLKAEIYSAIWSEHPRWKRTEEQFKEIKREYRSMVERMLKSGKLDERTGKAWLDRVDGITIELPGSNPRRMSDGTDACATTEVNAYYSRETNHLTVCAGFFNGVETLFVIGHEIGHALDPSSTVLMHEDRSELGKLLHREWDSLCEGKSPTCPTVWSDDLAGFAKLLEGAGKYSHPGNLSKFLDCLRTRKIDEDPTAEFLENKAQEQSHRTRDDLANWDVFLDGAVPMTQTGDEKLHQNPYYLRPYCKYRDEATSLASHVYMSVIYTAELVCAEKADPSVARADRIRIAGTRAREVHAKIARVTIPLGGRASESPEMTQNGYSQNVGESFADVLGARAIAGVLAREPRFRDAQAKVDAYRANIAWSCPPPSTRTRYQAEADAQAEFSLEPHPPPNARLRRFLTPEVQEALGCSVRDGQESSQPKACTEL